MGSKPKAPVFITRPYLPPLEEVLPYLREIWETRQLTNGGPLHQKFEQELAKHLGVKHISLFSNGTLALLTALKALNIRGEVITTPYSFVATAHSLLWNGIKPIFCDIDPKTMCLDSAKIESAITRNTTAILPVHVYGYPCDVEKIKHVADEHGLKIIYDAAHAFDVRDSGGSILRHGDLSVLSFHATKVFTTFEGGAIISPDEGMKKKIDDLKNFGFANETSVAELGINGKMSEINAAVGLAQLAHIDSVRKRRRTVDQEYRNQLANIPGISCPTPPTEVHQHNYSYFPILVGKQYRLTRDQLFQMLRKNRIIVRRYFYPLISDFPMYAAEVLKQPHLPCAREIANQILCLPIYPEMSLEIVSAITAMIRGNASGQCIGP